MTIHARLAAAKAIFPQNGVTVAAQETIDPTGTDFTTQMSELKAAKVDSVMTLVSGAANIIVAKDFQALNMPGNIYLLNASLSQLPDFGAAGPKIITPEPKVAVASQVTTDDPFTPMINSFVAAVKGKGVPIDLFGTEGYAGSSIRAVSAAASLNSRYFYESFSSREDLLYHVYRAAIAEIAMAVIEATAKAETVEDQARVGLRAAWMVMTTSPAAGTGSGNSSTARFSMGPNSLQITAFIRVSLFWRFVCG